MPAGARQLAAPASSDTNDLPTLTDRARVHRFGERSLWVTAVGVLGLVILGSLTPFRFAPDAWANWRIGSLVWTQFDRADALANVAVYLPVGALLFAAFNRRLRPAISAILVILLAGGLSFSLESVQIAILTRVPSWCDLALNILGAAIGVVLAVQFAPIASRAARAVATTAASASWQRYVCVPVLALCWLVLASAVAADGVRGGINILRGSAELHGATVPLVDYFYQPFWPVTGWLLEIAVVYAALAWTLSALRVRMAANASRVWWFVAVLTLALAAIGVLEVNGRWSISDAIVGAVAMLVGWMCHADLHRVCKREMTAAEMREIERKRKEAAEHQALRKTMHRRAFG